MSAARLKIIAIDDDPADQVLLDRYLREIPAYDCELTLHDGMGAALDVGALKAADVIFLDYLLGKETGLAKLRALRAAGVATPVVILTGQGDEELVVELMRAGATDYLAKARLAPETLERTLRNALKIGALERQTRSAEENLRLGAKVIDNMLEGVIVTDAGANILSVNPAFANITGYQPEETVGKNPNLLRSDFHDAEFFRTMWRELEATGYWRGEIWNKRKSGEVFMAWQTISVLRDAEGKVTNYVSVLFDITERHRQEEHVRFQAYHDVLTGLPNRQLFRDRLTQALSQARRNGEMLSVMFLDLDRFKEVNDQLGHDIGDKLLKKVAKRIKADIREGDTVARLGGDEFVLLVPRVKRVENLEHLAHKLVNALRAPFRIEGHSLKLTISIGVSVYPADGDDTDLLIKRADDAMYQAKQAGRNTFRIPMLG